MAGRQAGKRVLVNPISRLCITLGSIEGRRLQGSGRNSIKVRLFYLFFFLGVYERGRVGSVVEAVTVVTLLNCLL